MRFFSSSPSERYAVGKIMKGAARAGVIAGERICVPLQGSKGGGEGLLLFLVRKSLPSRRRTKRRSHIEKTIT